MYGWKGKVLRVNLTNKKIAVETPGLNRYRRFLGGRGLGASFLWEEVGKDISPLSAENKLIFMTGSLTGTDVTASERFTVTSKSPLTGTVFDGNSGGKWGVMLKKAGYDGLIIEGKSPSPVYLVVNGQEVLIKDAGNLWGMDVMETTSSILGIEGPGYSVACIGPAGENQVKIACIVNDITRPISRGGLGAVMGSKGLKAIAVQGNMEITVADREKLGFILYETNKWIKANPITSQGLPDFGSPVLVNLINDCGLLPAYNFQESQFAHADNISGETLAEKYCIKSAGCYKCPINCLKVTKTPNDSGEGPDYETIWAFGPQCGIHDLEIIIEATYLCVRLGLDTISAGATIGCAMEMTEKGIMDAGIRFGESTKLKPLLQDIAYKKGTGGELADGARLLASRFKAEDYAVHVKGLEIPAYDPRGAKGMGLGFATSNKGGSHLSAYTIATEILGVPKMIDRLSFDGKAGLTIFHQNMTAVLDSIILCRYLALAVSTEYFARMVTAVTGEKFQSQDLYQIGERIWNLEKLYNLREGFTAEDDTLPKRLLEQPVKKGPSKGHVVELEPMLEDYYRFRGWDNNGIPYDNKLCELGLEGKLSDV